jgi:hypothetical protein
MASITKRMKTLSALGGYEDQDPEHYSFLANRPGCSESIKAEENLY